MNTAELLQNILGQEFGEDNDDLFHWWDPTDPPGIAWCGADLTNSEEKEYDPDSDVMCPICEAIDLGEL